MQQVTFGISWILIKFMGLLPESLIRRQISLIAWILRTCVKYRKKVLFQNLNRAFPDRPADEIERIAKANYHILATTLVESLRGFTMKKSEVYERFQMENTHYLDRYYEKGQSVLLLSSHIGNWEFAALGLGLCLKHPVLGIYKPLSNPYLDKYVLRTRSNFGVHLIPVKKTQQAVFACRENPGCLVLVADQSPGKINKAIWSTLFGIPTPFVHGPEVIAKQNNWPVFYGDIQNTKPGHYTMKIEPLAEDPSSLPDGEITARYAAKMESIIRQNPADWLWTHRRWKRAGIHEMSEDEPSNAVASNAREFPERK
ncbi:MAG: lysophospholipid acyltransferase family protein [Saprospiraceae bacterium]